MATNEYESEDTVGAIQLKQGKTATDSQYTLMYRKKPCQHLQMPALVQLGM